MPPLRREPRLPADLVVYKDDRKKKPYIVAEIESTSTPKAIAEAKREGLGKCNLHRADYLLVVCEEEEAVYYTRDQPSLEDLENYRAELPVAYAKVKPLVYGNEIGSPLKPVPDVKTFRTLVDQCHCTLRDIEHKTLDRAFEITSRLIHAKIWDEMNTPRGNYYNFQIGFGESAVDVGKRINELYKKSREQEPHIFPQRLGVDEDKTLYEFARIFGPWSLMKTDLEIKGEAYQEFLDVNLRGEWGQFFTPRTIVRAMVEMADPDEYQKILDPACGTGGFFVYAVYHVRRKLQNKYGTDQALFLRRLYDFSHYNLYGIEVDDRIAQAAISNMILTEDAHGHLLVTDALQDWQKFQNKNFRQESMDLILTNPPLGIEEKRENILANFELGRGKKSQIGHILFLERCLEFLKPGGLLCTIMSEDVLESNPEALEFIYRNAFLRGIVSLPREAFMPYGSNAKTNILILQKKKEGLPPDDYVFMSEVKFVGYDKSGRVVDENDLPRVVELWNEFWSELTQGGLRMKEEIIEKEPLAFVISKEKITNRADVKHAFLIILEDVISSLEKRWKQDGYEIRRIGEIADLSEERIKTKEKESYEFISVHFDGTASSKGKLRTRYSDLYRVHSGEIVASRIDLINGAVAIVPPDLEGTFVSKEFFVLKPREREVNPEYLWLILQSEFIRLIVKGWMTGITGRHRINWEQLANIKIPLPDSKIQNEMARPIKESLEYRKKALFELKKSIEKRDEILSFRI